MTSYNGNTNRVVHPFSGECKGCVFLVMKTVTANEVQFKWRSHQSLAAASNGLYKRGEGNGSSC